MAYSSRIKKDLDKSRKRTRLKVNKIKGKMAEEGFVAYHSVGHNTVTRTGKGHDFKKTHRSVIGRKYEGTTFHEVKTGKSKQSKLQKKTQKKMGPKRYKVDRI